MNRTDTVRIQLNEVAYKVISLINMTHTQRDMYSNWRILLSQISKF